MNIITFNVKQHLLELLISAEMEKSLTCEPNHDKFIQGYYSFILAAAVLGFKLHITSLQYNKYWVFGQFM